MSTMPSPKLLPLALALTLAVPSAGPPTAAAQPIESPQVRIEEGPADPPAVPDPETRRHDTDTDADPENGPDPFHLPIPVGHEVKGIRVPTYDVHGAKQIDFFAEQARRVDENNVRMTDVSIHFFNDEGARDIQVSLPVAVFNMDTQLLGSDKRVRIERDDFVISGDKMVFHLGTRQGKLTGDIKMLIFDKENL